MDEYEVGGVYADEEGNEFTYQEGGTWAPVDNRPELTPYPPKDNSLSGIGKQVGEAVLDGLLMGLPGVGMLGRAGAATRAATKGSSAVDWAISAAVPASTRRSVKEYAKDTLSTKISELSAGQTGALVSGGTVAAQQISNWISDLMSD